ncbi:hypothetical protein V1T75_04135 [Tenacibaculum sp. FZY0031]|uniref:hypothetical protein n=1 Tax=Tenacibaculum sp. FZY0031 TaxID=3116648 RepID=UPI002E989243|nr:hypothetical protein [Tenacibaculum sp. FZY0031]
MKKIISILIFLFCFFCSYSQTIPKKEIVISNIKDSNHHQRTFNKILEETKNDSISEKKTNSKTKKKDNEFPWHILLTGFLGAILGLTPYFYEKWKCQKYYGKLIGSNIYPGKILTFDIRGTRETIHGFGYRYKINLISNKDSNIKKVELFVKYDSDYLETKLYFINNEYPSINPSEYIQMTPLLKAQKSYVKYLNFIIPENIFNIKDVLPEIAEKIHNKEELSNEDYSIIQRDFSPKKIKLIFTKYDDSKTKLEIDILNEFDFYSIVPEN